jgi:hypothetical protein
MIKEKPYCGGTSLEVWLEPEDKSAIKLAMFDIEQKYEDDFSVKIKYIASGLGYEALMSAILTLRKWFENKYDGYQLKDFDAVEDLL